MNIMMTLLNHFMFWDRLYSFSLCKPLIAWKCWIRNNNLNYVVHWYQLNISEAVKSNNVYASCKATHVSQGLPCTEKLHKSNVSWIPFTAHSLSLSLLPRCLWFRKNDLLLRTHTRFLVAADHCVVWVCVWCKESHGQLKDTHMD